MAVSRLWPAGLLRLQSVPKRLTVSLRGLVEVKVSAVPLASRPLIFWINEERRYFLWLEDRLHEVALPFQEVPRHRRHLPLSIDMNHSRDFSPATPAPAAAGPLAV